MDQAVQELNRTDFWATLYVLAPLITAACSLLVLVFVAAIAVVLARLRHQIGAGMTLLIQEAERQSAALLRGEQPSTSAGNAPGAASTPTTTG
jgi:hypothetical protein